MINLEKEITVHVDKSFFLSQSGKSNSLSTLCTTHCLTDPVFHPPTCLEWGGERGFDAPLLEYFYCRKNFTHYCWCYTLNIYNSLINIFIHFMRHKINLDNQSLLKLFDKWNLTIRYLPSNLNLTNSDKIRSAQLSCTYQLRFSCITVSRTLNLPS